VLPRRDFDLRKIGSAWRRALAYGTPEQRTQLLQRLAAFKDHAGGKRFLDWFTRDHDRRQPEEAMLPILLNHVEDNPQLVTDIFRGMQSLGRVRNWEEMEEAMLELTAEGLGDALVDAAPELRDQIADAVSYGIAGRLDRQADSAKDVLVFRKRDMRAYKNGLVGREVEFNGQVFLNPSPGTEPTAVVRALERLQDNDLASEAWSNGRPVATVTGSPITAKSILEEGSFSTVDGCSYFVLMNDRPVFTDGGEPYVVNLHKLLPELQSR